MPDKGQLLNAWVDATINNDRDILKLSFGGLLLVGSLIQFINFPAHASAICIIWGVYILSTLAFLVSLFTSLYKLKINADYLLEFGTNGENKERLKTQIKLCEHFMIWSFIVGVVFTVILILYLLTLK